MSYTNEDLIEDAIAVQDALDKLGLYGFGTTVYALRQRVTTQAGEIARLTSPEFVRGDVPVEHKPVELPNHVCDCAEEYRKQKTLQGPPRIEPISFLLPHPWSKL